MKFDLGPAFWSSFARNHWEKRPALLKQPFARPPITAGEIFRAVVDASERYREEGESVSLAFYIEHARQVASVDEYLPVAADKSMARYASRISRKLRGRRFALIVEDIQAHSVEMWLRFREFLRGLDEAIPNAGVNRKATVFVGNYEMTPSGLHVGTSGNFKFVVLGRKRMRFWPDEFFRGQQGVNHTVHVERLLPAATTLEGDSGDVIYWPSDRWHIGEAVGGLSVSVSLAVFVNSRSSMAKDVWLQTCALGEEQLRVEKEGKDFPAALRQARATFRKASGDQKIAERLKAAALNQRTGAGFGSVPLPLPRRHLKNGALVRCNPCYPILWERGEGSELICSANGHAFAVTARGKILPVLERLNSGKVCEVNELMAQAHESSRAAIRTVLEKLYSLRAVSEVCDVN